MLSSKRHSKKVVGLKKERGEKEEGIAVRMGSTSMRLTFENVIHSVSSYEESMLDKDSVVKCLKSMYEWMVFDSNMQLELPTPPGSGRSRMWPHGAVIDTRRRQDTVAGENSARKLKDVSSDHVVGVASSVVSSNMDDKKSVASIGQVMRPCPDGTVNGRPAHSQYYPSSIGSTHYTEGIRMVPERYNVDEERQYGNAAVQSPMATRNIHQQQYQREVPESGVYFNTSGLGYAGTGHQQHPYTYEHAGTQPVQRSHRTVPRYSVLGGTAPPAVVPETPESAYAQVFVDKKSRKPKIGTAKRRNDTDGMPVTFADEE